ncbi:type II secretion system major pseudopilin GspG [Parvularcula flava]|uniref:Type II secretion system core protein G n=1 Tax=Aquisalinus luteolus TaxID=1566827 RepID=A0A8J3ERV7_9PROT|nr:type II secretion system major pseudopilin GspG [Aquisalinus luteolus]NHK29074.1 type II secretion system major pseudopilin GspG [Aquisalinus luteolus]GGI00391.1 type II secretion system protein GspG [Aquisalinus luteolus]
MNLVRKKINAKRRQRGLTLVELMVVIVILGLLTTIIVINVIPAGDQAAVQKARTDISVLENALEQYRLNMMSYPTTEQGLEALVELPNGVARPEMYRPGGYIKNLPTDPWGNEYVYQRPGTNSEYDIFSYGADGREGGEGTDADIGNW